MFTNSCSLIIPTRNRHKYVKKIFKQLKSNKIKFQEILVIDSSDSKSAFFVKRICAKHFAQYFHTTPSISYQRNLGLKKRNKNNKYVMFLDDDIFFLKKAFHSMNKMLFDYRNNHEVCGFGFNLQNKNYKPGLLDRIKKNRICKFFNLYSVEAGKVMKSGWHTKIENLKNNQIVDWIYTAAVVYKNKLIKNNYFDNSLGVYSYLEDLDFCLNFKKKNLRLIINCSAKIKHPNVIERNDYKFGLLEILNRYYLVKKHSLCVPSFYLAAIIRSLLSIIEFFKGKFNFIYRFFGNICGILFCLFNYNKRK